MNDRRRFAFVIGSVAIAFALGVVMGTLHDTYRDSAKRMFGAFFVLHPPAENYVRGEHTKGIIRECQAATDAMRRGECYYGIVNVAPRHGKSDIVSRRYPVWHIGNFPDHEVILASYSGELATDMSMAARACMKETAYLFGNEPAQDRMRKNSWGIKDRKGGMNAVGLGGSITGRGAHLLVIDDYIKNRAEAESEGLRNAVWESFRNDLFTRLAPVHAVIIVATRWHEDDLVGRIVKESAENEHFPKFKITRYPAQDEGGQWLFPQRFSESDYLRIKAAVGSYAWSALYQQDPAPRTGNLLRADLVNWIEPDKIPEGLQWRRGWDVASSEKERIKDDPDFTVGTLAAYDEKTRRIYVRDVTRGQWSTLKRDDRLERTAREDARDGVSRQYIEAVGGYVDTFRRIQNTLRGVSVVRKVNPDTDKVSRASLLEPIFEAGNVFAVRAPWNQKWQSELLAFPSGKHDDQVDSLVIAVHDQIMRGGGATVTVV